MSIVAATTVIFANNLIITNFANFVAIGWLMKCHFKLFFIIQAEI